ncbi:TIGR03067 domain-containing protein [Peteryoungia ipomoeae]|uniref:TIGR03067 domain-containing protein n=1 Tax=Peteryoungia ipomoeae TaxID=1210932 RepID=A0A4S8NWQ8_9HYPH|nr:TIGR03067 domain-containing protein [Peteryoungia ipomoeae]THV21301.1 TIGR03067 domain-containing protein [Peteryoungia ipomoeae]
MTDFDALQGRWRQVRFEENGVVDPPDTHGADGAIMTISGNRFHVAIPGGETLIEGAFVLDETTSPKAIDWIDSVGPDAGRPLPAIYTLSSDSFAFAAADADMQRPADFRGGPGVTLRGFSRA